MNASWWVTLIGAAVYGAILSICGIHVPTWRFWLLGLAYGAYGAVSEQIGRHEEAMQ